MADVPMGADGMTEDEVGENACVSLLALRREHLTLSYQWMACGTGRGDG